jgi:hypothetical protein
MFDHLLTYRTELPSGTYYWKHYGPAHLTYLAGFALLTIIAAQFIAPSRAE